MTSYRWNPIKDIPDNWHEYLNQDLHNLASAWQERILQIKDSDQLISFNEKLSRQWAIETGIIERIYTLDRGITQLLIEKGIEEDLIPHGSTDKPRALVVSIIQDQKEVVDGLFDFVANRRELTTSYIKQMHQVFTRNQRTTDGINQFGQFIEVPIIRGEWKKLPNNPQRPSGEIHEYCPPEQVASEMDRLLEMHFAHKKMDLPPELESAWLHHRFSQIHPFHDGNGRVARALASLVFLRSGWFPLVITNEIRSDYINALEQADYGNLFPIIQLFARIEISAFRNALSLSDEMPSGHNSIEILIKGSVERIQEKRISKQSQAFDLSKQLEQITQKKLTEVAREISPKIKEIDMGFWASVTKSNPGESDFWYRAQIDEIAIDLNYFPNLSNYRSWVQLKICEERVANLTFSFHGLGAGSKFLGLMAVSAFIEFRSTSDGEEIGYEGPFRICQDIYQFSFRDHQTDVVRKYSAWLNETILIGLGEWQRKI